MHDNYFEEKRVEKPKGSGTGSMVINVNEDDEDQEPSSTPPSRKSVQARKDQDKK